MFKKRTQTFVNQKFGKLIVVSLPFKNRFLKKQNRWLVECKCICNKKVVVIESTLVSGKRVSCGSTLCSGVRKPKKIGEKYGRWTVIEDSFYIKGNSNNTVQMVKCRCDCGTVKIKQANTLGNGSRSCGCLALEIFRKVSWKHGDYRSSLYGIWAGMKQRCFNKNNYSYRKYGARNVSICDDWLCYVGFRDWALANGYQKGLSIDRIDSRKSYEPSNCRWVTKEQNSINVTLERDKKIILLEKENKRLKVENENFRQRLICLGV